MLYSFLGLCVLYFGLSSPRKASSGACHHLHIDIVALVLLDLLYYPLDVAETVAFCHFHQFSINFALVLYEISVFDLCLFEVFSLETGQ